MILGLSGYARSGKDTIADYLVENYGFTRMAFADPMREALYRLNPRINVGEMIGVSLKDAVDNLTWEGLKSISPDIRGLLQRMGTEVGREMFGEDIWVNYALEKADSADRVVFADVRFVNEADAIHKHGGSLWRIERPGNVAVNDHVSERALDEYKFDLYLNNYGTKELLFMGVDSLIGNVIGRENVR